MTDLSQNLLAAARQGLSPGADVAARVRARVLASAAPAPAVATAVGFKIGGGVLVLGIVLAGLLIGRGDPLVASPRFAVATADTEPTEVSVQSAALEPAPPPASRASKPATHDAPLATLAREVELIDRAMLALRAGTPAAALAAIEIFDRETRGSGQLTEDAQAIAIEAHCRLGHQVGERLDAFDRRWPSSAQRDRVRAACKR